MRSAPAGRSARSLRWPRTAAARRSPVGTVRPSAPTCPARPACWPPAPRVCAACAALGDGLVQRRDPLTGVHHEQDDRRRRHGEGDLLLDLLLQVVLVDDPHPAGVHEFEIHAFIGVVSFLAVLFASAFVVSLFRVCQTRTGDPRPPLLAFCFSLFALRPSPFVLRRPFDFARDRQGGQRAQRGRASPPAWDPRSTPACPPCS